MDRGRARRPRDLPLHHLQDSLADAEERIAGLVLYKGETAELVKQLEERLSEEESGAEALGEQKKKSEETISNLKKDIEDVTLNLQKAEQDKQSKDNQIKVSLINSNNNLY